MPVTVAREAVSMADGVASPNDPLVDQLLLGRFQVTGVGTRTRDVVAYDGIDTKTQKPVRIQRPKSRALTQEQAGKVKGIGSAMLRLKAVPGVLGPLDGGIHAGAPFLVFPSLPGGTLAERLRHLRDAGGAPAARSIRQWLKAVASTLDEAHKMGVCHGRLTADCIVVSSDGSAHVDGLPLSKLLSVVGRGDGVPLAGDTAQSCRAPELADGAAATAASDQYALAAVVAEALGYRPRAVEKALAERPDQRYPTCADFAADLLAEIESSPSGRATAGASASPSAAPLELAETEASAGSAASGTHGHSAAQSFQLELEETEGESAQRKARKTPDVDGEVYLGDITFTAPGQSLLAPKTTYQKATDLGGARAAWRRMGGGLKELPVRKQLIARVVIACVGLLVALWLVRAGWRAADWVVRSGRSIVRQAAEKVNVSASTEAARESGAEFAARMRGLWDEFVVEEDENATTGSVVIPVPAPSTAGDAWPAVRPQDRPSAEQFNEPTNLIQDLVRHRGAFTGDGLGVFSVDDPEIAGQQSWVGGFGMDRRGFWRLAPAKPKLHGTLVHRAGNGNVFVARFLVGKIRDFWCMEKDPTKKSLVVYSSLVSKKDEILPDGVAVVFDAERTACLALLYQDGQAIGGSWCVKKPADKGDSKTAPEFELPATFANLAKLEAQDERFGEYVDQLGDALAELPHIRDQAIAELRKFVRQRNLK